MWQNDIHLEKLCLRSLLSILDPEGNTITKFLTHKFIVKLFKVLSGSENLYPKFRTTFQYIINHTSTSLQTYQIRPLTSYYSKKCTDPLPNPIGCGRNPPPRHRGLHQVHTTD